MFCRNANKMLLEAAQQFYYQSFSSRQFKRLPDSDNPPTDPPQPPARDVGKRPLSSSSLGQGVLHGGPPGRLHSMLKGCGLVWFRRGKLHAHLPPFLASGQPGIEKGLLWFFRGTSNFSLFLWGVPLIYKSDQKGLVWNMGSPHTILFSLFVGSS